jgi:hypothetical protein
MEKSVLKSFIVEELSNHELKSFEGGSIRSFFTGIGEFILDSVSDLYEWWKGQISN